MFVGKLREFCPFFGVLNGNRADLSILVEVEEGVLVKIALSPTGIAPLLDGVRAIGTSRIHISAGGNVAYVSVPPGDPVSALDQLLQRLALAGVTLWGIAPLWLGKRARPAIASAVKLALDPTHHFPFIDD